MSFQCRDRITSNKPRRFAKTVFIFLTAFHLYGVYHNWSEGMRFPGAWHTHGPANQFLSDPKNWWRLKEQSSDGCQEKGGSVTQRARTREPSGRGTQAAQLLPDHVRAPSRRAYRGAYGRARARCCRPRRRRPRRYARQARQLRRAVAPWGASAAGRRRARVGKPRSRHACVRTRCGRPLAATLSVPHAAVLRPVRRVRDARFAA